jgi:hypothetical protein
MPTPFDTFLPDRLRKIKKVNMSDSGDDKTYVCDAPYLAGYDDIVSADMFFVFFRFPGGRRFWEWFNNKQDISKVWDFARSRTHDYFPGVGVKQLQIEDVNKARSAGKERKMISLPERNCKIFQSGLKDFAGRNGGRCKVMVVLGDGWAT